jgi:UPF0755 protein
MKGWKARLGILLGAVLVLALALTFLPASFSDEKVDVSINAGWGSRAIAAALRDAGAVRSSFAFRLACYLSGNGGKLKAGDYEVPKNLNAWQMVDLLVSGKALQRRLVIPEGLSSYQIAALLDEKKWANGKRFLALVHDPIFVKKMGVDGPSLEGYLFPDSYEFARGIPEETLLTMMVQRFHEKVDPGLLAQGEAFRMTPRQALTLASMIEKEARLDDERPKVARVFLNRRLKKMRLESCATVRYALNKYSGPVLYKDLDVESPYNTYRHAGFPPGPICSPGLKSIEAAVHPADGSWLFFVVTGDGSQAFSDTFEEHKAANLKYKRLKRGVVEE